jgi:ferric-dicitrate binding protein FerR (iron transport regulator)
MKEETKKILLNKSTPEESEEFYSRLQENPERETEFKETFLLQVFSRMIFKKTPENNKEKMFKRFWSRANSRTKKIRFLIIAGQAAAILFFIFYTSVTLHSSMNETVTYTLKSERGSVSSTVLEDETEIWLNSSSSAQVKKKGDDVIAVSLRGEGFFDVKHNPDREFIVEIGTYQLRDIGTSFNVKAYPDENKIIVSVFDGIAQLETSDNKLLKNLEGGDEVRVDLETGAMTLGTADYLANIDWKNGKFAFEEASFSEILEEFEEWYDVQFVINNESINNQLFTGVLKRKSSIEHLMYILKLTSEFEYTIKIQDDGSSLVLID